MNRPAPTDPGLQPERTALAHLRTGLTIAAVGVLLIRQAHTGGQWLLTVAVTAVAVAVALGGAWWRHHLIVHRDQRVTPPAMVAITVGVLVLQVIGLVLVLRI